MTGPDGQPGDRADGGQSRDNPPHDPTTDDSSNADPHTDDSASNDPTEVEDRSDSRQWPIVAIVDHRADPDDATRLQLRIKWAEVDGSSWDPTWEPESNIQLDAPHLWNEYASRHNCRDALGRNRNKYHILYLVRHEVIRRRRGEATVVFDVQWEGSATLSKLSEKAAKGRNAELVADYWEALGGREKALKE
ncbi:hypothetical protein K4K49_003002 [Colletotrichum sp. SAR 10_70]|nr:hypothetical protein K4K50_001910 [Colletotrichum sp. SAR 10_71]KAI8174000.1 hypothetical protein K4K49_003002 [Colletotrichum sp. SAR 10_70]KAI8177795.1 hypothetical protein K4K51_005171 [Colletotrichum sp. SAR 10_75]KAI8206935.1 hypothetical protein K4K52_002766 [Colletotrichum sp. SAR 10_76]KAI8242987.1 hypothetical protein K4K53_003501 [Colletotrichum sp. SAR 10_77]